MYRAAKCSIGDLSRRKHNNKNRIEPAIEEAIVQSAYDHPAFEQLHTGSVMEIQQQLLKLQLSIIDHVKMK